MSHEDLSAQASSDASASGHHTSGTSYDEEDHRRLLFGLMRSGLTPQVELALRLIDEASHSSRATTSYSVPSSSASSSFEEDEDEDSLDSADEYSDDGDEDQPDEGEEGDSPALTTKPLRGTNNVSAPVVTSSNNASARPRGSGWAWAYSKSDDQQNASSAGQPYVERWLADVHGRSEAVV